MSNLTELPMQERVRLVKDLWDSVAAESTEVPVDQRRFAEVRSRMEQYRLDGVRGVLARDAVAEMRNQL